MPEHYRKLSMRARSLALAWIGGPVAAHLIIALAGGGFDPTAWAPELRFLTLIVAAVLGLAFACLSEGDFNARA
jgi:hypothetical protein